MMTPEKDDAILSTTITESDDKNSTMSFGVAQLRNLVIDPLIDVSSPPSAAKRKRF